MASSLSNRLDNLAEGVHKIKCKECDCFLAWWEIKKKEIKNIFKFSNNDINKFILLLRTVAYPYDDFEKFMDDWDMFNETTLPEKEEF